MKRIHCLRIFGFTWNLLRPDVQETLGAKGSWSSCNMLANKLYIADFMKNYHNEVANLLENGLDVSLYGTCILYPPFYLWLGPDLCW